MGKIKTGGPCRILGTLKNEALLKEWWEKILVSDHPLT
ncbi:hypothetical protein NC99_18670 [Sunxiuqinia dokdonensis]|uniref:Uncharacterized protein n=1 Tax=Sunxiuqinia dokdonensis TaxID=1409788 RepID=A0A0L8VA84_9BACT|nr:hypothetical protein NC99_18670 [Sunxiuqinia dokdonensis]